MFLNASPKIFEHARLLRKNETPAEKVLWSRLSGKQLGVKFRRQNPMHLYVVDFYCHDKKLAIELDGSIHNTYQKQVEDNIRTDTLNSFGIRLLRFRNEEALHQTDSVIEVIKKALLTP